MLTRSGEESRGTAVEEEDSSEDGHGQSGDDVDVWMKHVECRRTT